MPSRPRGLARNRFNAVQTLRELVRYPMFLVSHAQTAFSEVRRQNESLPPKQMECRGRISTPPPV